MGKQLTKQTDSALPMQSQFVDFEGKSNIPAGTLTNARIAINKLGLRCWHDLFSDKKYIAGQELNSEVGGQVTDDIATAVRVMIRQQFKFDPGKTNTWDAINLRCRENGRHPVRDFLNESLALWQDFGGSRIDTMLIDYFGAPDTPFVRCVSRIVMIASCRRIFDPGCKYDYMTVLESIEGVNKSSGLAALYGAEWFTDQKFLGLDDKRLAEALRGKWCVECADLSGMKRAEVEDVKAQLSRQVDRTRPAYGRAVIENARTNVFWGSTNDKEYLRSQTGNRRFFPVPVGRIDVAALTKDRALLWGEAMAAHLAGEGIMLPEALWGAAGIEQDARTMGEPWIEQLAEVATIADRYMKRHADHRLLEMDDADRLGVVYMHDGRQERVSSAFALGNVLGIPPAHQTADHGKRLGMAMRKLGWDGPKPLWIGGRTVKGYERPAREPWDR
jgi:predicted P-loop ATPase